jgi:pimeloyl-ACP methyl ester carboxylesterase
VLVHGAWHGAWCWAAVQAELDRRGVASLAVDLPGHGASGEAPTDLAGDVDHVLRVLDAVTGRHPVPVVLVGHSYGGAVVTGVAARRSDVAHLVYVAAFALEDGESVAGSLGGFPRREVALAAAMRPSDDGSVTTLDPDLAADALYADGPAATAAAALARLDPQTSASFAQPVEGDPRATIASTYVRCARDRAVHPDHQAIMAARCGRRVDLDADHSPFLGAVDPLADVLATIAADAAAGGGASEVAG